MKSGNYLSAALGLMLLVATGCGGGTAQPAADPKSDSSSKPPAAQPPATEGEAAPEAPTASQYMTEVQELARSGKLDEAEAKLSEAIARYPADGMLPRMHIPLYAALKSGGRQESAQKQIDEYVSFLASSASKNTEEEVFDELSSLITSLARLGSGGDAQPVLASFAAQAGKLSPPPEQALRAADAHRAMLLAGENRGDEARAIIDGQLQSARAALEQDPQNRQRVDPLASSLKYKAYLEQTLQSDDSQQAWNEFLDFLDQQARANPKDSVATRFLIEHMQRAAIALRTNPEEADTLVNRVATFLETAPIDDNTRSAIDNQVKQLRERIEKSRRMLALVGSPAMYPMNVDGWVNGGPLTPEELKGKVVLLDFFSIWCGPCIATFPHLRQWNEEYADQGLQIIGITKYYSYGWNEQAKRGEKVAGISPADERAAMEQFLAYHQLKHPVAYITDNAIENFYMVSGIPHVVVIDRKGIVRLFRIGSGESNAHDVGEMIKQCLAE